MHPEWCLGWTWGFSGTATLAAVIVGCGRFASLYMGEKFQHCVAYGPSGFIEVSTVVTVLLGLDRCS